MAVWLWLLWLGGCGRCGWFGGTRPEARKYKTCVQAVLYVFSYIETNEKVPYMAVAVGAVGAGGVVNAAEAVGMLRVLPG